MISRRFSYLLVILIVTLDVSAQVLTRGDYQDKSKEPSSLFGDIRWKPIGPSFQGGRVETVDCPQDQPGIVYAGFGSGGLWKSRDQGLTWACIFGDTERGTIGDLEISPYDPDILYLGTGENLRAPGGFCYPGTGVYKSVNGGKDWTPVGLRNSQHIGRIVCDPNNPDLVFVAVLGPMWSGSNEKGLFMSLDGGISWQKKLFISNLTGVVDVAWDPVNRILYAASWQMLSGTGSRIYRSADLGNSWQLCSAGLPTDAGIGRIGLAVSRSHPQTVYAVLDNRNSRQRAGQGDVIGAEVYRSDNSGTSWKKTHQAYLDIYSGYGWSFGEIRVSPTDRNRIYLPGIHTLVSIDGGLTFKTITGTIRHLEPHRGDFLHTDHYDLCLNTNQEGYLVLGTAGGVYISHNAGQSWLHCNNIPVGEFQDIYIDNRSDIPLIYGGTKDNAGVMGVLPLDHPAPVSTEWDHVWLDPWSGGDGFRVIPDPTDSRVVYYSSQNGYLNRKNLATGETTFIQPVSDQEESPLRMSWFTPWFVSRYSQTALYFGANKVYKSIDRGESWYRLSHDLCYPEDEFRKSRALTTLSESPVKQGLLYAGTDQGAVWISRDDGINWFDVSSGLPVRSVSCLCPSCHHEGRILISLKALDEDEYRPYLFLSEDRGVTWVSLTEAFPEIRINCIVEDPMLEDILYAGTDQGVYLSGDLGKSWMPFGSGLPPVSVQKLEWAADNRYLVAATHGRSLYCLFAEPIRRYFKSIDPREAGMLALIGGVLPAQRDYPGDLDWSRQAGAEVFWYQPVSGQMVITITDPSDKPVYSEHVVSHSGINVWTWDLIIASTLDLGIYPVNKYKFPAPGSYSVTIQGQGIVIRSDLSIR